MASANHAVGASGRLSYDWHEMTFCLRWDPKCCTILCLGVDSSFQNQLQQNLNQMWAEFQGSEAGSLLAPLIEVLVAMYDQSAYNMIAQRDSQIMTGLGEAARNDSQVMKELGAAAREDSSAMRTIAVVTMAFLPPTFLSAVFSMSFFNYTPPQDGRSGEWSISEKFWIYWAFAVPLTALTLGIWVLRQRWMRIGM
ncbi:hypothetical protein DDE82_001768 [Stemphylium lycopersici]|uniref:Uncharacterized protein n=1 Tax=Stemphylium lycopersici TaxID=183478 RepID=A0A364N1Z0_STELY|nr:hypothetical protein TW65_08047 [Stemphylium lycopersici]RAR09259.1 hypothetical protein DDE82_001768 [Stemphylium lycopersici]RAR09929.1 hypothetical protein DDE83_005329 [Stemphylium lycopersici]